MTILGNEVHAVQTILLHYAQGIGWNNLDREEVLCHYQGLDSWTALTKHSTTAASRSSSCATV